MYASVLWNTYFWVSLSSVLYLPGFMYCTFICMNFPSYQTLEHNNAVSWDIVYWLQETDKCILSSVTNHKDYRDASLYHYQYFFNSLSIISLFSILQNEKNIYLLTMWTSLQHKWLPRSQLFSIQTHEAHRWNCYAAYRMRQWGTYHARGGLTLGQQLPLAVTCQRRALYCSISVLALS